MDKKKERVVIFIDGSNFYHSSKKLNVVDKINFQKLINELVEDRELAKVFYYNSPLDISVNPKIYWKQQKFFDMLRKIPKVEVILCKQRKVKRDGNFEYEVKGDDTHLHFKLLKLGLSQRQVVALYWCLALTAGVLAFGLQTRGKFLLMVGLLVGTAALSWIVGFRTRVRRNV